jgi:anti-sigma regulatory factor (Ser/Thr protein kinase)
LVEAHNKSGEMFSFPRLRQLLTHAPCSNELIDYLIQHMQEFTGKDWEQEDDVTFLTLENTQSEMPFYEEPQINKFIQNLKGWETLAEFQVPSAPGNEREAIRQVSEIVSTIGLPPNLTERLKTAVGEATMNAMEHGNKYQADLPVDIVVRVSPLSISVRISDYGGGSDIPYTPENPDINAKLRGEQSPRGWGLFIIENMVDGMVVTNEDGKHTMDLILLIEGDQDGASNF